VKRSRVKKNIYVGGSLREAGQRFVEAWHRAERGEKATPEDNVTFVTWSALASAMTDKRHALLRYLRRHPTPGIRALARALGRDYKRVHEDVVALMAVGLIEKEDGVLRADYDEIQASIKVKDVAA
jgi:predicted transcriptional regulator